jgi:hypothetical protein
LTFNPIREKLFSKDHSGNYMKIIPAPQKKIAFRDLERIGRTLYIYKRDYQYGEFF